jgi:hypothetical protein
MRPVEMAGLQFKRQKPTFFIGAGHGKLAGLFRGKAEAPVIFRITDKQDRAMAKASRLINRMTHQGRTDAATGGGRFDGERPQQQGGYGKAKGIQPGMDIPQPHGACERSIFAKCSKSQPFRWQATATQLFRGFAAATFAHRAIKQRFARQHMLQRLAGNCESRGDNGCDIFLNFQSCVHHIYPRKAAAAHPSSALRH